MSDERNALAHLLLGVEELLRAGADAAAMVRDRSTPGGEEPSRPSEILDTVRESLRREIERWELRCGDDPAALRVRDLFESILDVLEPSADREAPSREDRARKPSTRAPRREAKR